MKETCVSLKLNKCAICKRFFTIRLDSECLIQAYFSLINKNKDDIEFCMGLYRLCSTRSYAIKECKPYLEYVLVKYHPDLYDRIRKLAVLI